MKSIVCLFAAVFAVVLAGCTSFEVQQTSMFTDENGNILTVEYGRDRKEHESKFIAPNGREMSIKSKLKVRVTLPDGSSFVGWECLNPLQSGTMYRSNNEKWMFHANGISCRVYSRCIVEGKVDYLEIFNGIICRGGQKGGLN